MLCPVENKPEPKSQTFCNSRLGKALAERNTPVLFGAESFVSEAISRDALQAQAVQTLFEKERLLLQWGTGVGKSRVAVMSVQSLVLAGKDRILLLVAETDHKRNWRKEFTDHYGEGWGNELFDKLTVECYQSLCKYRDTRWDLIIADEAHHLRSDKRTDEFSTLHSHYVLCVSATISDRGDADNFLRMLDARFGEFASLDFSVQDGINNKFIAEPKVYIHLLDLKKVEGRFDLKFTWGFPKRRREVSCTLAEFRTICQDGDNYPAAEATVSCGAKEGYDYLCERIRDIRERIKDKEKEEGLTPEEADKRDKSIKYMETEIKMLGNQRKTLLGWCKTEYAKGLLGRLSRKRYICFCTDVRQAELLGASTVINSDHNAKTNAATILSFNEGRTSSLYAVGMLREGTNLSNIDAGVIIQLGGKERLFIQEFGRALRAKNPEQHVIVIDETRDVDYCNIALSGIDLKYITVK